MLSAQRKIAELERELASLKNRQRFDDLDSVKKAFIAGYGSTHFDEFGWNENVVGGYVERTRGSALYRPDEYITLVIETKSSLIIRVECVLSPLGEDEFNVYDGKMKKITEPRGNDFEKYLIAVILCNPYAGCDMYWFENINLTKSAKLYKKQQYIVSWKGAYMQPYSDSEAEKIEPLV
jgi:hypothetical protein